PPHRSPLFPYTTLFRSKQRVPDDETSVIVGEMRELAAARNVADGIDAPVRGLEPLVDYDAVAVAGNAGTLERKVVHVRLAARGDEKMAGLDRLAASADEGLDFRPCAFQARDAHVAANDDALARERVEHDRRAFGVVTRQRLAGLPPRERPAGPAQGPGGA